MSLLVVGSVGLDSVETPFGKEEEILGGSAVHFSASASFFVPISMVGVVGEDFPRGELEFLKRHEVDLEGLQVRPGKTFRWRGRYGFDLNTAETLDTQLNVFADFSPEIPESYRSRDYLFLGNIHPVLQKKVLGQVRRPRLIALDTMNFWISGQRQALIDVLRLVDLVVINEAEARQLAGEASLVKVARKIQSWGPKTLIVKQGEYGALLFHGDEVFSAPGLPLERVIDPTGAGDSFAGGLMGFLARNGGGNGIGIEVLKQAVIMGSVMASFNVEDFSCRRLKGLTMQAIGERAGQFKRLAHFEELKV